MKNIIICADDYGQNHAISAGIIKLVELKRISATSCLVKSVNFAEHANLLKPFIGKIDIGLHFDLTTDGSSLGKLAFKSQLHLLSKQKITEELKQQLELFTHHFGITPNYIDGHQHIHQFPIICNAVIDLAKQLNPPVYIRYVHPNYKNPYCVKQLAIAATSDLKFKHKLQQAHITHNKSFAGVYDFSPTTDYGAIFHKFLTNIADNGLIMCHPAQEATANDPIAHARVNEFNYFQSGRFIEDCHELQISVLETVLQRSL
jgi:chitin disaccharide deacetylase